MRPLARRDGLVVRDLAGETLVYDRERHQAHCLNPVAASVFRLCDGQRDAGEIASLLDEPMDLGVREAIVASALGQLAEARLLADVAGGSASPAAPSTQPPTEAVDRSRRDLLRRVGTALLVPAIASIVAPTPAQAASAACVTDAECSADPFGNYRKECDEGGGCSPLVCCDSDGVCRGSACP